MLNPSSNIGKKPTVVLAALLGFDWVGVGDEVACVPPLEGLDVPWLAVELVELERACEELEETTVGVEDGDEELEDSGLVVPEPPPTTELLV